MSIAPIYMRPTDRITAGAWTLTGTARAGYPVTALDDGDPSAPVWITGNSIVLVRNMTAPTLVDGVTIHAHTLVNASVLKVQMHTADSWATPDVDITVTIPTAYRDGFSLDLFVNVKALYPVAANRTKQYLRVINTVANPVTVAIGEIAIWGAQRTFSRTFSVNGLVPQDIEHLATKSTSKRGVSTVYDMGTKERRWTGVVMATQADLEDLLAWREDARGIVKPSVFVFQPGYSGARYAEPVFCRFASARVNPSFQWSELIPVTIELEELGRGELLGA